MGTMIGSGVFLLPASLAPFGWNAVIAWCITIAGAMAIALTLARLARAMPEAGGPLAFVAHAFGPFASFVICWTYLVANWTGIATVAVAAVSYLTRMVPALGTQTGLPALVAAILIAAITAINMRGAKAAGGVQLLTLSLKLVPLLVVIVVAALVLGSGKAEVLPFRSETINAGAVTSAATLTLWAMVGLECASLVSAKVENPSVNVARATLWGTGLTGLIYLVVCSAVALLLPQEVAATSPAPFGTFVERFWGPGPAGLITLFAIVSCIGAINGMMLVQGELPRGMAVDGLLPKWFGRTDLHGTSKRNLLISGVIACVFVLMNSSRSTQGLFEFLLLISTSATLFLYLACALAAIRLGVGRGLAIFGAVYAVWTLWGAGLEISAMIFVLVLLGLPLWVWARREIGMPALKLR